MLSDPATPRFGANYVPSSGWFYSWLDYDGAAVRRDFADLAGLGLDHVRVFPIWPWIQPNRAIIRERAIDDLLDLIDAAAEHGLSVAVDLIQGHLSSFDFLPSWVLTWHRRSLFEDPAVRDGLTSYVDAVARAVATRPNVFAITLGNEVNNLWPDSSTT
ncbi:MAG TPA: glycosyl hydrolase, partial [Kribbella sp.]